MRLVIARENTDRAFFVFSAGVLLLAWSHAVYEYVLFLEQMLRAVF